MNAHEKQYVTKIWAGIDSNARRSGKLQFFSILIHEFMMKDLRC